MNTHQIGCQIALGQRADYGPCCGAVPTGVDKTRRHLYGVTASAQVCDRIGCRL